MVMVQISLPERLPRISKKGLAIGSGALAAAGLVLYLYSDINKPALAPAYDIVLPQRTSIDTLGGWQRVNPTGNNPIFAYTDDIDGVPISVSQQPIPESFKGNIGAQVKQLAESYRASTVFEAGGTEVYMGKSARGPQSIIFAKSKTLVLIKSQDAIAQDSWITYINNLVDPNSEQLPSF